ncbi:MAG: hypothetical protein QM791_09190 [Ferruginibacter sp.]
MEVQIILFITLLFYSIVVSQSFSYIISLTAIQQEMDVTCYIKFRQATDKKFQARFKPVIYVTLFSNILLVTLAALQTNSILFISANISLLALIADIIFTLKGNVPINNIINKWTVHDYPADWQVYRKKWFSFFCKRQIANIIGFIGLLAGTVIRQQ